MPWGFVVIVWCPLHLPVAETPDWFHTACHPGSPQVSLEIQSGRPRWKLADQDLSSCLLGPFDKDLSMRGCRYLQDPA